MREDPLLSATVVARRPLLYARGADASLDRPAHVRAASAVAWVGRDLVAVQDDASFLAQIDPATASVLDVPLPAGPRGARQFDDARGNKADKMDLEACFSFEQDGVPWLVAFGSGSTRARERVVLARFAAGAAVPDVRVVVASSFYESLRTSTEFSGSELNIEGAALVGRVPGGVVRFFNRGNGAPRGSLTAIDATVDVDLDALLTYLDDTTLAPPPLTRVTRHTIGTVAGARLTFTDACAAPDGALYFLAAAEDSPDATRDGPVSGTALGVMGYDGEPRWTTIRAANGALLLDKTEGIALQGDGAIYVLIDKDNPKVPSELLTIELRGPWRN